MANKHNQTPVEGEISEQHLHTIDEKSPIGEMVRQESLVQYHNSRRRPEGCRLARCRDALWRERVAEWKYSVVDRLDESREVVHVSMSMLDRYLTTQSSDVDQRDYQLAAMTALLLAIKIRGKSQFGVDNLVRMGGDAIISRDDIIRMGRKMMRNLTVQGKFEIHPTPMSFVRTLLDILQMNDGGALRSSLLESSAFLVELSVCDSHFSKLRPSTVAMAAMKGSFERQGNSYPLLKRYFEMVKDVSGLEFESEDVDKAHSRLKSIYHQCAESSESSHSTEKAAAHIIPREDDDKIESTTRSSPVPRGGSVLCDEINKKGRGFTSFNPDKNCRVCQQSSNNNRPQKRMRFS